MKSFLIIILSFTSVLFSAQKTPLEIAEFILSNKEAKEKYQKYLYENRSIELDYKRDKKREYSLSYREFKVEENYVVVDVTAKNSDNKKYDFYLYFRKDNNEWKIFDAQKLPNRTFFYVGFSGDLSQKKVDSIIQSKGEYRLITSQKQFDYIKNIYSLGMKSDDEIIQHFKDLKPKFLALKNDFIKFKKANLEYTDYEKNLKFRDVYDKLTLSGIDEFLPFTRNTIAFIICREQNNAVGYFYTEKKKEITIIDPGGMLFIREIGDGWYLFKMKDKHKN
ncbi:hypothetical protein [Chryseobacterium schmidteae]|uniref:hypothetical protein n=1 Tax=Chryseobacterium schmidteae TaxID=2730404 RepID=UPI0015887EC1|nr:hypothetical protein [Chryseobacterium schmidteae]